MVARVRCSLGGEKGVLNVTKDGEGRLAFKGFSFSMDARVSIMRTTAAANGKRNRELDRRAWGMSVFGVEWGLSEDMKGIGISWRAGATQTVRSYRIRQQKIAR
jgi:hypothetical protein